MSEELSFKNDKLNSIYQNYERQKCFIGLSQGAHWRDEIVSACQDVLLASPFQLEPWYADSYYGAAKSYLQDIIVEMIANARYGIYDLSYWRKDDKDEWVMPRNVFIELGIAIGLNRPMLLLQHEESRKEGPELPECLEGIRDRILPFTGDISLKNALEKHLPNWVNVSPDHEWRNRYCLFGACSCFYRDRHPRVRNWIEGSLPCLVAYGQDHDQLDFRGVIEHVLSNYNDVQVSYFNEIPIAEKYDFLLCTYCQSVRSTPFAIYRITPRTTGDTFISIGISIAIEYVFNHRVPKLLLAGDMRDVPSLLSGYKVAIAKNNIERKRQLQEFIAEAYRVIRGASWKSRSPLPFIEVVPRHLFRSPIDQSITSIKLSGETDQTDTNQAEAFNQQGDLLYSEKRFGEALLAYEQATLLDPDKALYHYNSGLALYSLNRYDEALAAYRQALQVRPDYALAYGGQGVVYIARKEYQDAIQFFDRALALDATITWVKTQREEAIRLHPVSNVESQSNTLRESRQDNDENPPTRRRQSSSGRGGHRKIFLIRNGESHSDVGLATTSPKNLELTSRGYEQSNEIAAFLRLNTTLNLIVTSPYLHSKRTAQPTKELFPTTELEEWEVQEFTYLSPTYLGVSTSNDRKPLVDAYWEQCNPGFTDGRSSESFNLFFGRVQGFIRHSKDGRGNIAIFSHEQFIAAVLWTLQKKPTEITSDKMREFRYFLNQNRIPNGAIVEINVRRSKDSEDSWVYELITQHLNHIVPGPEPPWGMERELVGALL